MVYTSTTSEYVNTEDATKLSEARALDHAQWSYHTSEGSEPYEPDMTDILLMIGHLDTTKCQNTENWRMMHNGA